LRKNATKGKKFPQALKPVESMQFTPALQHRPPEEKDFSRSLSTRCIDKLQRKTKFH
jgi:hypothetical protein